MFDVASLAFSIVDVCQNPDDVWTWVGLAFDIVDLLPIISGTGEVADVLRFANKADNVANAGKASKKGWKVGEDITTLTKKGDIPSWSTVRSRYWKNEAHFNLELYSNADLNKMRKGLAPTGWDGFPMELHHTNGQIGDNFFDFKPITRTDHYYEHYRRWPNWI